jgi:hypothetical protein
MTGDTDVDLASDILAVISQSPLPLLRSEWMAGFTSRRLPRRSLPTLRPNR